MSVTFSGGITFTGGGFSFTAPPAPPSEATAGWYAGGVLYKTTISRITYSTDTATASTRGPLTTDAQGQAGTGNTTYGWLGGGNSTTAPTGTSSTVQRITYATDTAATSIRGPLNYSVRGAAATGNTTDGWFAAGLTTAVASTVNRITYATDTATASTRGPLSSARYQLAATGNTTDGWFGGGYVPAAPYSSSTVNRITYATDTATASTRGPLSSARYQLAATGNTTDGWFGGGMDLANIFSTVNRITYATDTATASVRGPLSVARRGLAASGNTTDGWFGGGFDGGNQKSTVDRITYATDTATASVRGPIAAATYKLAATSGIQ
jgi:hypothetical protein